jgi:hypothetical protein
MQIDLRTFILRVIQLLKYSQPSCQYSDESKKFDSDSLQGLKHYRRSLQHSLYVLLKHDGPTRMHILNFEASSITSSELELFLSNDIVRFIAFCFQRCINKTMQPKTMKAIIRLRIGCFNMLIFALL